MKAKSFGYALFALFFVVGLTVPAAAVSTTDDTNNSSVNVTVSQQLSTVIDVLSDEVQTDFENTAFEISVKGANEEEQAEAISDRAEELRDRAEAIRNDYEEATEAYEEGEITKSEYAQRLATLNARATNLLNSYEQLQKRTQNVSALELQAAGMNHSALRASVENLSIVNGTGAAALLNQFTGEVEGEIELETTDGLSIEITSEDGEQSREIERPRDAEATITVSQSAALDTARAALSTPDNGTWMLTKANIKQDEGAYEFAFVLRGALNQTGEAEVSVDGSSGKVFTLEEETQARSGEDEVDGEYHEEDDQDAEEENDSELAMVVSGGTPGPNATVTVQVLLNGAPAGNVTVFLNEQAVGTTDADGTMTVTLPGSGDAALTAQKGGAEGELEFEFEEADDENEVFRHLNVDASLADDNVSVSVAYNGSGVSNAMVYANGQAVGTTSSDGTVTFTIDANATEELELEVVKGAFEAELQYTVQNRSLTLAEEAHKGDGDKAEAENEIKEKKDDEKQTNDDAKEDADKDEGTKQDNDKKQTYDDEDKTDEENTTTPEEKTDENDES